MLHISRSHLRRIANNWVQIGMCDRTKGKSPCGILESATDTVIAYQWAFARITCRRSSDVLHAWTNPSWDCRSASRFGNTRSPRPGTKSGCNCLTSSRKTRFARLRRTAFPNRRPTIIPIRLGESSILCAKRLKSPVEIRRPCCLTV
jgi:hypothetical protein